MESENKLSMNFNRPQEKGTTTDDDDTFYLDFGDESITDFTPVPSGNDLSPMEQGNLTDPDEQRPDLLLPSHVFRTGILPHNSPGVASAGAEDPPAIGSLFSDIKSADGDSSSNVQRYFHVIQQSAGRSCSTCGGCGHLARTCKVLLCWTCGARDTHESRDCPINITCWNCGRRGHASANCAEPRARRQCQLCGSRQHVQNSCPSLWRIYCHISPRGREGALKHRANRIGLELGEGGEGFIAWDAECFVCGAAGHWGYDCSSLPRGLVNREPPAFSRFHADTKPWPFDSTSPDSSGRFAPVLDKIRQASGGTAGVDGVPAALQAGRKGKEKMILLAQKKSLDQECDRDDDNWFDTAQSAAVESMRNPKKRSRRGNRDEIKFRKDRKPDDETCTNGKYSKHEGKAGDRRFRPQFHISNANAHKGARNSGEVRDRAPENTGGFPPPSPSRPPMSTRGVSMGVARRSAAPQRGGEYGSKWRGGYTRLG